MLTRLRRLTGIARMPDGWRSPRVRHAAAARRQVCRHRVPGAEDTPRQASGRETPNAEARGYVRRHPDSGCGRGAVQKENVVEGDGQQFVQTFEPVPGECQTIRGHTLGHDASVIVGRRHSRRIWAEQDQSTTPPPKRWRTETLQSAESRIRPGSPNRRITDKIRDQVPARPRDVGPRRRVTRTRLR